MDKPAPDDPTRVLDGWKPTPGRGARIADPTRVLDGWKPEPAGARAGADAGVGRRAEAPSGRRAPDPGVVRLPEDLDLRGPIARASKWATADVVDAQWKPSAQVQQAALQASAPVADAQWQPSRPAALGPVLPPRVLAAWKPGAWVGAVRQVFESVAQVVSTAQGPVVDTFAPHLLLALWPPQSTAQPFLGRWPQRVALSAVAREEAALELLKLMPDDSELWLAEHDIDWALLGEAVLLHEPGLRDFQLKELRAFVDHERQATWDRANQAYRLPATGQPLERV